MDTSASSTPTPQAGFRSRLALIGVGVTLFAIGQSLLFTIVSPMARSTGLTEVQFGLALTVASLPLVFGAPFWGRKSDEIGRKPIFVFGLLGSAAGTALVALALDARLAGWLSVTGLVIALVFARGFYSLTASALYPSAGGYIADVTDFRNRAQGMAILGASNSLGAVLGPLLAAALAFAGPLSAMYVAAVIMAAGAIAALKLLKEPERHQRTQRTSDLKPTDPRLRPFMVMWLAFFLTFSSVQITTGFYIQDRLGVTDPAGVVRIASFCLVAMAVVITVMQGLVFQMLRISPLLLLRCCGPAFIMALLTMAQAHSVPTLIAGFAILGLAFACATPGINGGASLAVEPHQQGAASGYLSAANTVGAIFGPLAGTSVYRVAPPAVLYAGAALFLVVSIYAFTVDIPAARRAHT
jgi:MFS family permease